MPRKKKKLTTDGTAVLAEQKEEALNGNRDNEPVVGVAARRKAAQISGRNNFFIVGIGASAGGLDAFKQFLSHMPPNSGMAFVFIQHLSPDYNNALTDILKEYTTMRIFQAESGMQAEPNCIYIKPPDRDMMLSNRIFHLIERGESFGFRHPIDFFFQSLAEDCADKAIGIIFSGTGTDGTLGLKAIKGAGGATLVQEVKSAEFSGMPVSAIATGCVNHILRADEMPDEIIRYVKYYQQEYFQKTEFIPQKNTNDLEKVFGLLQLKTGHNFTHYRYSTVSRRIGKRMAVNRIETLADYVVYLQQHPSEVEALFKELTIGVTKFFRDKEVCSVIKKKVIPHLFEHRDAEHPIRVWVAGCATGEEAYTIAILLAEYMDMIKRHFKIQIFATDIDPDTINFARAGIYPESIVADIPRELLKFFICRKDYTYIVDKRIREMVIFASHNLIKDPPFSKLDLISCRNLLIYLEPVLQKKLIPLFHYILNPDGFLILGNSETIGEFTHLFSTVDKKYRIFQRKGIPSKREVNVSTAQLTGNIGKLHKSEEFMKTKEISISEVTKKFLLEAYCPSCVVINERFDIVYFQGHTDKYLEPPVGEPSLNILKMAREDLRLELRSAIYKVIRQKTPVVHKGLRITTDGKLLMINLVVRPFLEPKSLHGMMLVMFEESTPSLSPPLPVTGEKEEAGQAAVTDRRIKELEDELNSTKESLRNVIEELEISNEKFKTANEMIQTVNEELQSANEELETSKEELQSINEELIAVNKRLQNNVEELSRANNDINNMLSSADIGTIFLDKNLCIKRYTPAITRIINLIESDIGRSIRQISTKINGENLVENTENVLATLLPYEREVLTRENKWYLIRILPYRTENNMVDGAVITFVDITEFKHAQEDIRLLQAVIMAIGESEDLHAALVVTLRMLCEATGWTYGEIWMPDPDGTCLERSKAWYSAIDGVEKFTLASVGLTFPKGAGLPGRVWSSKQSEWVKDVTSDPGFIRVQVAAEAGFKAGLAIPVLTGKEAVAVMVFFMFEAREEDKQLVKLISSVASQLGLAIQRKQMEEMLQKAHNELEKRVEERSGELLRTNMLLREEITERKRVEKQLLKFFQAVKQSPTTVMITDVSGNIEYVNPKFTQLTGYTPEEVVGKNPRILKSGETPPEEYKRLWDTITSGWEWRGEFCNKKKNGELYWEHALISPIKNPEGVITHFLAVKEDITGRKQTEKEFQKAKDAMKRQLEELQRKLEVLQEAQNTAS